MTDLEAKWTDDLPLDEAEKIFGEREVFGGITMGSHLRHKWECAAQYSGRRCLVWGLNLDYGNSGSLGRYMTDLIIIF